jgi:O-antigen ligase
MTADVTGVGRWTATAAGRLPRRPLLWLLGAEVFFVGLFLLLAGLGLTKWAIVAIAAPVQLVIWALLVRSRFAILLFVTAVVPLAFAEMLPPAYQQYVLYPGTVLLLLLTWGTGYLSMDEERTWRLGRWELLPMVLFGVWTVLSCANALLRGWSSRMLVVYSVFNLEILVIGACFAVVPKGLRQVKTILYILIGGSVLMAVLIPFMPGPIGEGGILGGKLIVTPFAMFNLNHFGGVMAMMGIVVLALLTFADEAGGRLLWALVLLPLVVTMVLTKSRGAWLGFALGFIYLVVRARSFRLVVLSAVVGFVLLSFGVARQTLLVRTAETSVYDPSLAGRLLLWKYAWEIGKRNWVLGVGTENFRHVKHLSGFPKSRRHSFKYNAHNLVLENFANLGVVGLVCFFWMFIGAFRKLDRLRHARDPAVRGIGLGLAAAIVVFLGHGLVDSYLFVYGVTAMLAILLGLSVALERIAASDRQAVSLSGTG